MADADTECKPKTESVRHEPLVGLDPTSKPYANVKRVWVMPWDGHMEFD